MTYGTTQESAQACADWANANPDFRPSNLQRGCTPVRYEVRPHAWLPDTRIPSRWGVWPVWAYDDQPDLGAAFGGPFIPLKDFP